MHEFGGSKVIHRTLELEGLEWFIIILLDVLSN